MNLHKSLALITAVLFCNGCDIMSERLDEVGRVPALSKINVYEDPEVDSVYEQVAAKSGFDTNESSHGKPSGGSPNSIWQKNSRSFFQTHSIGDVLSVVVQISDQAKLDNKTQKSRNSGSKIGMPSMFGLESVANNVLPGTSAASNLVNLKSNSSDAGSGKVDRKETVQTTIAVTVIRILPSGNLVVKGSQEIRVNFDVREVTIEGIVCPKDISRDNKVKLEQIAEARVSYGGRGQIFEYQQAPYGKQVLDVISPF